ncbi:hypothetical protein D3C74_338680 [compost metagenome]
MNPGNLAQMLLADEIAQTVTAQQQKFPHAQAYGSQISLNLGISPQRSSQYIAARMIAKLLQADLAVFEQLINQRMILG